jgi:hypothetical protein
VGERQQPAGDDLPVAEAAVTGPGAAADDAVDEPDREAGDEEGDDRRDDAGISTLPTRPSASTRRGLPRPTAEPTTPPIRACEELEGRPKDQVIRFQAIAPISPAKTIVGVITSALTTSFGDVAATEIEMKGAERKLSSAAGRSPLRARRPVRSRWRRRWRCRGSRW